MNKILRCIKCLTYTLNNKCPQCNSDCHSTRPAKFSPEDKYGEYRRKARGLNNDL
ncbi:RNA-protein complex protein Nop10 [Candidatus Woesearchaeota archaeon]|nr:RNA-protein complex protein Nop10 [Candidatus Woesearchaeota archaeon]